MPQRSFCPISAALFQLLRDSCCSFWDWFGLFPFFFFHSFNFFSVPAFGFFFFSSPCGLSQQELFWALSFAAALVFYLDSSLFCLIVFLSFSQSFIVHCYKDSFCLIGPNLFQLLRDFCWNKQPSRLSRFLFFSSLCDWRLKCSSSSSLRPSYRHILTSSSFSSVHLLLLVSTKWFVYGDNGVWFLFHYETCGKKNIFGQCKGCSQ